MSARQILIHLLPILLLTTLVACERHQEKSSIVQGTPGATRASLPQDKGSVSTRRSTEAGVASPQIPFRFPAPERLVAIGDLHGDFEATLQAFRLAGAIDGRNRWKGEKLVIVQTGDQLDRGDQEEEILSFLRRLQDEAQLAGGRVLVLNGNHETMNVLGDFRYVTRAGLVAFSELTPASPLAQRLPPQYQMRGRAFLPGGGGAKLLAKRPLIAIVGETVFVHGGVLPAHVDYGIERLNRESSAWMRGDARSPPAPLSAADGPLWTRVYGPAHLDERACALLDETLKKLKVKRMVVGHSVQQRGMSGACDEKVFRIDVGLAAYYGERAVQVLEINHGEAKILSDSP